ncbi:MAG TPA: DNA-binding protein [Nitrososphaeraceae archaeon]|nr:DNA-binding protein [Nitrososphaeraceae archaeon]
MSEKKQEEGEDPDIAAIKARKMKALREQAAAHQKEEMKKKQREQQTIKSKSDREFILDYLYDRGEEVLNLAESQFPTQTKAMVRRIVELIKNGEIKQRISGGELLALFRFVGMNIRLNTTIKIEDHGKLVSFSDKLKQENEDMTDT